MRKLFYRTPAMAPELAEANQHLVAFAGHLGSHFCIFDQLPVAVSGTDLPPKRIGIRELPGGLLVSQSVARPRRRRHLGNDPGRVNLLHLVTPADEVANPLDASTVSVETVKVDWGVPPLRATIQDQLPPIDDSSQKKAEIMKFMIGLKDFGAFEAARPEDLQPFVGLTLQINEMAARRLEASAAG